MKQVKREILLNWWLQKYHNITVKEIIEKYDKNILMSANWFKMFPVTSEQELEWINWAKDYIRKETKMSKYMIERQWPYIYLDCSPYVIVIESESESESIEDK